MYGGKIRETEEGKEEKTDLERAKLPTEQR
jgi:hypothetical protein